MNKFHRFLSFLKSLLTPPQPPTTSYAPEVMVPVIMENSTLLMSLRNNITASIIDLLDARLPLSNNDLTFTQHVNTLLSQYINNETQLYLNIILSLLFLTVIAVSLIQPLYFEMNRNESRIKNESIKGEFSVNVEKKEKKEEYVKVKDIILTHKYDPAPLLPSPRTPEKINNRTLQKIHKSTLKLHSLLGVTFKHLNTCDNPEEIKEELLMAEGCVCSAVVKVLEEIEDELGGKFRRVRSPVVLPK